MTLVQLEYVVALDRFRHFALAAANCYVTQPTLSMQIHKLEQELGFKIFDRSKQPVMPTEAGLAIIEHAKKILAERDAMNEMLHTRKGILSGELKDGHHTNTGSLSFTLVCTTVYQKISACKIDRK